MKTETLIVLVLWFLWTLINYAFLISFHNIDLSVNICNLPLIDEGIFGNKRTIAELYKDGIRGLFFTFIISNIIFILTLTLYFRKNK